MTKKNPVHAALALALFAVALPMATGTYALLPIEHRAVLVVTLIMWSASGYFFAKIPKST